MEPIYNYNQDPQLNESLWHKIGKKFENMKPVYRVVIFLLVLLICFGSYVGWYAYRILRPADLFTTPNIPEADAATEEKTETKDLDFADYFEQKIVNVVLLGFDVDTERRRLSLGSRTDTIKVISVNFDRDQVSIIDVPRDSYVKIADTSTYDKINSAYYYGYINAKDKLRHDNGVEYALKSISNLFGGMPLHYYVTVDMDAVVELVDSVGGIKFNVPYDVIDKDGVLQIPKGERILDGEKYLHYLRNREVGGDIGRMQRQTELLLATLDHFRKEGLIKNIPVLYEAYQELIDTNLSNQQIIALALYAGRINKEQIISYTLSGSGQSQNGIYYMVLDTEKIAHVMQDVFGVKYTPPAPQRLTDTTPAAPKAFTATLNEAEGQRGVKLTWSKGDKYNLSFRLYRTAAGGSEEKLAELTGTSFLDAGVEPGVTYTYRLEAVNRRAVSAPVKLNLTVPATFPRPEQPQGPEPTEPDGPQDPWTPVDPEDPAAPEPGDFVDPFDPDFYPEGTAGLTPGNSAETPAGEDSFSGAEAAGGSIIVEISQAKPTT
ncbi:MAG: hypothetical protein GX357_05125 [Firmicutes bacterium]|nr:hypothetical protein [Bacillota bacterium]